MSDLASMEPIYHDGLLVRRWLYYISRYFTTHNQGDRVRERPPSSTCSSRPNFPLRKITADNITSSLTSSLSIFQAFPRRGSSSSLPCRLLHGGVLSQYSVGDTTFVTSTMVPALLVWLRVVCDGDMGGRLDPDAATRRVYSCSRLGIQYLWNSQLDILCNVFADYHAPHWWFYNCGGSFQDEH